MTLPCTLLVSRGGITVRGILSARQRTDCVEIRLAVGDQRLSATPAPDGTYVFVFVSCRRLLWATLSLADSNGCVRWLRGILIWNPDGNPAHAPFNGAFDPTFYLSQLSLQERSLAARDPLGHYLSTGWQLGAAPHRWFDPAWYLRENPALLSTEDEPFSHYLAGGWKCERHPHPGFDNTFYLSRHPELMQGEKSPLHHWNRHRTCADLRTYIPHSSSGPSDFTNASPYRHASPETMRARVAAYRRDRKPGNTVAYFTCLTGNYDTLRLPEHLSPEIDYHVFADQPVPDHGVFKVHLVELSHLADLTRRARHIKTHPHTLLPGYDTVVFGDANVIIRGDLMAHIRRFIESGLPLAFLPHPLRICIYEEAVACVAGNRDTADRIVPQMLAYRKEGFPAGAGLSETNLFACRLRDPATRMFFKAWWAQIDRGSKRDQLSAHYVLWKLGLKIHPLLGDGHNTRNHPDTALIPHGVYDAPAFAHLIGECSGTG